MRVMTHAPFYQMSDDTLIRIGKEKKLVGTVEGETVYGPPVKRIYIPKGTRSKVVHAVHAELGHAGQSNTANMAESMFAWPALHRDTKTLVKHCGNCQFRAAKAPASPHTGAPQSRLSGAGSGHGCVAIWPRILIAVVICS